MKITFRQIDAFRTVISTGSVTEAAEILGVSQPAVSRLIADLESEVGFTLFERSGRSLLPTEEARLLVQEVRQAVSGMEHIKVAARGIAGFGHARLRLVTTPALSGQLAPMLVSEFAARFPEAMVRLEIEANDDTVEWLVSQSYEFGLSTSEPASPALESLTVDFGGVYCILPTRHRLEAVEMIEPEDLEGESFISYLTLSRFRHEIDRLFEDRKIARKLQYETRTTDAIYRLVAQGLGVSVVAAGRAQLDALQGCRAIPFEAPLSFRSVLIWSRDRRLSTAAQAFLDIAQDAAKQGT